MRLPSIPPSEITPPEVFARRRQLVLGASALLVSPSSLLAATPTATPGAGSLGKLQSSPYSTDEKPTPLDTLTSYGNFYEFGPDKDSPARHAHRLKTRPWTVTIEGEVKAPKIFALEDILKWAPLEERIYRFRCVEGWSAVVPWVVFPLAELIKRADITGNARYVEFWSLADPEQMPYVRTPFLNWPYIEALRLDEALHPLTLLTMGLYGQVLPNQNGAPLRLVVPWKYGFKGAKSLV